MLDQRALIADLEAEIEALHEAAERCTKLALLAKAAVAAGAGGLVLAMLRLEPVALVVGSRSNRSTWHETMRKIAEAKARRSEVIDGLQLQHVVDDGGARKPSRLTSGVSYTPW
jgi:hypothetical protein